MRSSRWLALAATAWGLWGCDLVAKPKTVEEPRLVREIYKTSGPVKIDGRLDERSWRAATPFRVDYIWGKKGTASRTPKMTVRYLWDEHYLYIGYETVDKNLVAVAADRKQGPEDNQRLAAVIWKDKVKVDVVEFFLSFEDRNFLWEIHHNATNQFNDIWITVLDPKWRVAKSWTWRRGIIFSDDLFLQDDYEYKLAIATQLKPKADGRPSTVNDETDVDSGYVGEMRLPWGGLATSKQRAVLVKQPPLWKGGQPWLKPVAWKMAGAKLAALAVMQDGDAKERYFHDSPTRSPYGWFHKSYDAWPVYTLVNLPGAGGK